MIKFFRKIRQHLLAENKLTKYIFYALGEIFLVVIGILIALQVNNWNEERKEKIQEQRILVSLHNEFLDNHKVLSERIKLLNNSINAVYEVISFMGSKSEERAYKSIDSIIWRSMGFGNFNPSNSNIQELIQSGRLNLVKNVALKQKLYDWIQMLEDTNEDFKNQDLHANVHLANYLNQHYSLKNLQLTDERLEVSESSKLFDLNHYNVFNDIQFENILHQQLFWHTIMRDHYKELDSLTNIILKMTNLRD